MEIPEEDLLVDIFKTDTGNNAVRIVHIPTGNVSQSWNSVSVKENKELALQALHLTLAIQDTNPNT
jgi:protein subunit release factor A